MKTIFATFFIITVFAVFAGEREELLEKFEKEYTVAEKNFLEKAETTIELVGAAGNCSTVSEKHLFQAFDYKLRHTFGAAERLRIISDFHKLTKELHTLHLTPRSEMGTLAGMWIYYTEANLMRQQIAVWMLNSDAEKRWKRIADTQLVINSKNIKLECGKAKFNTVMHDQKVILEIVLFPQNTFTHQGRDFAIIEPDIPFAGNDDFSKIYLCELKNGKLEVRTALKMPYFTKWELKGKKLIVFGKNSEKEEFCL